MGTSSYKDRRIRQVQCSLFYKYSLYEKFFGKLSKRTHRGPLQQTSTRWVMIYTALKQKVADMNTWSHTLHCWILLNHVTEGYSLWCPVHSLVSLYEFSYRVAVRNKDTVTAPKHIQYTHTNSHTKAHTQYTHTNVNTATIAVVTSSWDARIKYTWKNTRMLQHQSLNWAAPSIFRQHWFQFVSHA